MPDKGGTKQDYLRQLDALEVEKLRERLVTLATQAGRPIALCCFERPGEGRECHRWWWASWWLECTGERVPEWGG
jgi:hypothetical protein